MNNENLRQCMCCHCDVFLSDGQYIDNTGHDNDFVCNDCIQNGDYFYCNDCECWHTYENNFEYSIHDRNGNYIYSVCCGDDYIYCNCCEQYYENSNNAINLNDGDLCYCEKCQEENTDFYYCDICEEYYTTDYREQIFYENGTRNCCEYCAEDTVRYCDICGNYFDIDNTEYDDYNDQTICVNCKRNNEDDVKNRRLRYHEFSNWQKHYGIGEDENNTKTFYGVELEVDTKNESYTIENVDEFCKKINSKINSICEKDGSLSSRGIEIITHPSTLKYYYENYDNYKDTFKMLLDNDYLSHDLTCCGLHIHVTRPDDDTIDKILCVMEHYKEEIFKFSRRINSQMGYCKFLSDYEENKNKDEEYFKSLYYIKKDHTKNRDRYMALNLSNYKTIEFRIFRGTLNVNTFYSCLEFVKNIVELCKNESELKNITWERLTKGRYISKYIKERNIYTNKKIYDNSKLIELRELKENKKKDRIIKFATKEMTNYFNKTKNKINNISKVSIEDIRAISNEKIHNFEDIKCLSSALYNIFSCKDDYNLSCFITKVKEIVRFNEEEHIKNIRDYINKIENKKGGE